MPRQDFTASGNTVVVTGADALYFVDFTTPGGSGSAQLEIDFDGDWLPVDTPQAATMVAVERAMGLGHQQYRVAVTVTTGTVRVYIKGMP